MHKHTDNAKTPLRASGPEDFNREMAALIKSTPMIEGLIDNKEDFSAWLEIALNTESLKSINVSLEIMKRLHTLPVEELDMLDISYAINAIEGKTPNELKMLPFEYIDCMERIRVMVDKWNAVAVPIKEKLSLDFQQRNREALRPNSAGAIKANLRPKIIT